MTDLQSLRERLAEAAGPDLELDGAIMLAVGAGKGELGWYWPGEPNVQHAYDWPYLTASIDAAVALAKRVVPNFHRWTAGEGRGETFAYIDWREGDDENWDRKTGPVCHAPTAPLAILSALLAALEARSQQT